MRVVLLRDVKGLGRIGEVLVTSDGHARNYLIPKKLATPASDQIVSQILAEKATAEKKLVETAARVDQAFKSLKAKALILMAPADGKGHLYAGLRETQILAKIIEEGGKSLEQAELRDYHAIKQVGNHKIKVTAAGKTAEITISVQKNN